MLNSFPVVVPGWYVSKIIASVRFGFRYEPASLTHPDYPSQLSRPVNDDLRLIRFFRLGKEFRE